MGLMRFNVHDRDRFVDDDLSRTFIVGPDETPYLGRSYFSGNQLLIERRDEGSGSVATLWRLDSQGPWMLMSSSLMERERPYHLEVELARGSVFRLRNQLAAWETVGLVTPDALRADVAEVTRLFTRAATQQNRPAEAAAEAQRALEGAAAASLNLVDVYAAQALSNRRANSERLPTLLGVRIGEATPTGERGRELAGAFSLVGAACSWKSIEPNEGKRRWRGPDAVMQWAQGLGVRVCAGPLLEFNDRTIPEWAFLWEGDYDAIGDLMLAHADAVVKRYRGRVNLWNVAAQVNRPRGMGMRDEQRLQLVARGVRLVRQLDPKTPVIVSFEQPWAEYMASEATELSPLDFADALERADLGVAGFGLELNVGYLPRGVSPRNPLAFSRLLDLWSLRLESPLMVTLASPSGSGADPLADPKTRVLGAAGGAWTPSPQTQADWVDRCVPMMLAKNCVQVVLWNQLDDATPHELPHAGLLDAAGQAKPALEALGRLRREHLI